MRRKLQQTESVTYWKSMVDAITTLMMVILLVLMFFVLNFLTNNSEEELEEPYDGYENGGYGYELNPNDGDFVPTVTMTPTPTPYYDDNDDGGGGGEGLTDPEPTPEILPEEEEYGGDRAAIYVQLVDEETNQVIEVPEVMFELYSSTDNKQTLSTHYPELISYTNFETTENGDFYLPEKIRLGTYYFRQITELEGYDFTGDVYFDVDDSYDWSNALTVIIPFGPSRNNIQVQINDANTGLGLPGVKFNIIADGDVVTEDGTIRYYDGEVVGTITCDDTGYGLSEDYYLGNYRLQATNLPEGYAAPDSLSCKMTLPRRTESGSHAPLMVLESTMTTVRVNVSDELDGSYMDDMSYTLTCSEDPSEDRNFTSNSTGYFEITNLKKNATYTLTSTNTRNGYIPDVNSYEFVVDGAGYITGSPVYELNISNRMIRVEISILDRIVRKPISGHMVELYDSNGVLVESWVSDSKTIEINGLEEGIYSLRVDDEDIEMTVSVENTADIQKFSTTIMTVSSYIFLATIAGIIVIILLAVLLVVTRINKKRKRFNGK